MTHQNRPHATECSRGWACVETVRSGSREPTYLTPQLYTSASTSTTGLRRLVRHRFLRQTEKRLVEALAHGVVVAVEDGLTFLGTPARYDVNRRRLYLGEVSLDPRHLLEVGAEALSIGEVPGGSDHLATVVFLEVAGERVQHGGRSRRDVADPYTLDLSDRTGPEDRRDHFEIRTYFVDRLDKTTYLLGACHRLLAHREEEQVREEQAVGAQETYYVLGVLIGPCDEHAPLDPDRGHRRPRAIEDRNAGVEAIGDLGPLKDVRNKGFPCEAAAAPATSYGGYPAQGRRLVVVARGVRPAPEGLKQVLTPYLHPVSLDYLRVLGPSAAHRDHSRFEAFMG